MEKSNIVITGLSVALAVTLALLIYKWNDNGQPCGQSAMPAPAMRHAVPEADGYVHNYLDNDQFPRPIAQSGWLVNASELMPFICGATYVHISLARVSPTDNNVTLVISGATSQYDHYFPTGTINDGSNQQYALESVYPCPLCINTVQDSNPAARVNERLSIQPDALQRTR